MEEGVYLLKIAFWSNDNEKCQVSANLAAICVATVIRYPYTVMAIENSLCSNNLGKAFLGRSNLNLFCDSGTNYYDGGGLEGLIRKIYRGDFTRSMMQQFCKEIIAKHLYYLPQSRVIHNEIFDYEFDHCMEQLLEVLNDFSDATFFNTASNLHLSTKTILDNSDLIVVNLCQKQSILEDFFLNYSSLLPKSILLLSNYDNHTKLHARYLISKYGINPENIVVLPRNEAYETAYSNGDVVEFISRNYNGSKENPNYIFMNSVKKSTSIIVRRAVELAKQKELMCLQ